jgi:hypothetical protein
MLINHTIKNLLGGISQQPDEVRFDNQVESMENFIITEAQGLRKRNPVEFVKNIVDGFESNMCVHSYDRGDGKEKYGMTIDSVNGLRVFQIDEETSAPDVTITEKTVNIVGTNPLSIWSGIDFKKDIEFLTVGDTTWLLNKKQIVSMKSDSTTSYAKSAFCWIKRTFDDGAGNGYEYNVHSNGSLIATQATTGSSNSEDVASNLSSTINGLSGYSSSSEGSIFRVVPAQTFSEVNLYNNPVDSNYKYIQLNDGSANTYYDVTIQSQVDDAMAKINAGTHALTVNNGSPYWVHLYINDLISLMDENNEIIVVFRKSSDSYISGVQKSIVFSYDIGEIVISDSWGDQASFSWNNSVSNISDLPAKMNGYGVSEVGIISVTGDDSDNFVNYYLKWENGRWVETVKGGISYILDEKTMPAKIVRQSDGTFSFGFNSIDISKDGFDSEWQTRKVGDNDSNPLPSFVGNTISNMFFFKNRLGFTSDENVILSEVNEYYNFFRTTVIDLLDGDVIDTSIDSNDVSIIRNINIFGGGVLLWSDNSQFILSGGNILSTNSSGIKPTSNYLCSNELKPIVLDDIVVFFNKKGSYLDILSYNSSSLQSDTNTAESLSSHIPTYIPSDIDIIISVPAYNMILLTKSGTTDIYVYKYFVTGKERVISSWFKWTTNVTIKSLSYLGNNIYILGDIGVVSTDNIYRIRLEPFLITDTFQESDINGSTVPVVATLVMSKFNIEKSGNIRDFREPFALKTVKLNKEGDVKLDIINSDRGTTKTVASKHSERKLFVGGNSNNVRIGLTSDSSSGCQINSISIEGVTTSKSKNI